MSSGFILSQADLMKFAREFLRDRLDSLSHDVQVCHHGGVPFPALLYCFSVIDLLGSLLSGEASSASCISERSRDYMQRYMGYKEEEAKLIQQVFRHKLVHLAQPNPVMEYPKGRRIAWQIDFNPNPDHLVLKPMPGQSATMWQHTVPYDYGLTISIADLVREIHGSVYDAGKYLDDLASDRALQVNFRKAAKTIMNVP